MKEDQLSVVFFGLSITSSWGNGHATTYRALISALAARGHEILFLERDVPWYRQHRDLPRPPDCRLGLYESLDELKKEYGKEVRGADAVIVGSYVPEGAAVGEWIMETSGGIKGFYDIDTPITLSALIRDACEYLTAKQIQQYDIYFSFSGGPILERLERQFGAQRARALYCSVNPAHYNPRELNKHWDIGYLGTYSADRQPGLERLLLEPARAAPGSSFIVAGAQYPEDILWPPNVARFDHLPPAQHCGFFNEQRFTLNLTRGDMIAAGWSPSVRLFEAAACGTPIISDWWEGLDEFLKPEEEILIAQTGDEVLEILNTLSEPRRQAIGAAGRNRILLSHTSAHRAIEFENEVRLALGAHAGAST